MESQIRDIPGYYYGKSRIKGLALYNLLIRHKDKEKKKYFKIQNNSPASSAYSSQDVKRRKTRDEKNEERAEEAFRQRGRIQRSKILDAPLAGQILSRELGQYGRLDAAHVYSRGLVPQGRYVPSRSILYILLIRTNTGV